MSKAASVGSPVIFHSPFPLSTPLFRDFGASCVCISAVEQTHPHFSDSVRHFSVTGLTDVPLGVLVVLRQMASASAFQRPKGYLPLIAELTGSGQTSTIISWKKGARVSPSEQPPEAKGSMAFAIVLCLVALLVGGFGGWAFWKWREGARQAVWADHDASVESPAMAVKRPVSSDDEDVTENTGEKDVRAEAKFARLPSEFRRLRPKPENLKFDEDKIQNYISKLPPEYVAVESEQ